MQINPASLLQRDLLALLSASCAFCHAHGRSPVQGDPYYQVMIDASRTATSLFQTLALTLRNLQDRERGSSEINPVVGRLKRNMTAGESERAVREGRLNDADDDLHLRNLLNRFAHSAENLQGFRIEEGQHYIVIAFMHNNRNSALEFCIESLIYACGSLNFRNENI